MPFLYPVKRTLLLVAQPLYLDTADLLAIREKVMRAAPDIQVIIVGSGDNLALLDSTVWNNPTLTVSFGPVGRLRPPRGPIFANAPIAKIDQFRALSAQGVATPRTEVFTPGLRLEEEVWGPIVLVKPASLDATSSGRGLRLFRTRDFNHLQDLGPEARPAQDAPMLVQQFIDSGSRFSVFRNLTLFGTTLYQNIATAPEVHPDLTAAETNVAAVHPEPPRGRTVPVPCKEDGVISFAAAAAAAFPSVPLLGLDIVRRAADGRLFVIEVNAGGNVWHLSSPRTAKWRSAERIASYVRLFSPYDRAAEALVAVTRRCAR